MNKTNVITQLQERQQSLEALGCKYIEDNPIPQKWRVVQPLLEYIPETIARLGNKGIVNLDTGHLRLKRKSFSDPSAMLKPENSGGTIGEIIGYSCSMHLAKVYSFAFYLKSLMEGTADTNPGYLVNTHIAYNTYKNVETVRWGTLKIPCNKEVEEFQKLMFHKDNP